MSSDLDAATAADARLATAVVAEGQRWQAEVTNLRNALREAGHEMDRRYVMGESAGRMAERQRIRELAIEWLAQDHDCTLCCDNALARFADLFDGAS